MATKKIDWKVAFDPVTGHHQSWSQAPQRAEVDQYEFEDRLQFRRYVKGRSAINFIWEGTDGKEYTMFISDLCDAMPHIVGGWLSGTFHFVKRGHSTGVVFTLPD